MNVELLFYVHTVQYSGVCGYTVLQFIPGTAVQFILYSRVCSYNVQYFSSYQVLRSSSHCTVVDVTILYFIHTRYVSRSSSQGKKFAFNPKLNYHNFSLHFHAIFGFNPILHMFLFFMLISL
jgi:hypothetical protein